MSTPRHEELSLQLPTRRDLVRPLFLYYRAASMTFVLVLVLTVTAVALQPRMYTAEMKILVRRERVDPIMTSDPRVLSLAPGEVSEAELYSEVELLQSRDLLERVVLDTGLHRKGGSPGQAAGIAANPSSRAVARAIGALRAHLHVQPLRKTRLISVTYRAAEAQLAARVLDRLASLYLEKHLEVHRPEGAHRFFTQQAEWLQQELRSAGGRLHAFTEREQVISAAAEKDSTLQRLSEFEAGLEQTQAAIADASRRLGSIQAEAASTPNRQVTAIRNAANVERVRELKSEILQREITRNDMLQKFTPQYPPVMRLEEELSQLRAALTSAEHAPLRDETTDQNPTHQWLRNEAARVRTEHDALLARASATRHTIADYRERARRLEALDIEQQELLRAVKTAEENYSLYRRKQEEARISDALDRRRIANVAVAEAPAVPQAPGASRRGMFLLGGGVMALVLSVGITYLLHAFNPRFRTPDEVIQVLDVPVLAALPAPAE
jgi:uncharacterized protein involved in exopolysaccharide biosynthesis